MFISFKLIYKETDERTRDNILTFKFGSRPICGNITTSNIKWILLNVNLPCYMCYVPMYVRWRQLVGVASF